MKYKLILSIFCFVYILILILLSAIAIDVKNTSGHVLRGLLELLTIPTILAGGILLFFNGIHWKKEGSAIKSPSFYPFLLNVLTVLMMVAATIADL